MEFLISIFIWLGALIGIHVPVAVSQPQPEVAPVVEVLAPTVVEVIPNAPAPQKTTPSIVITPKESQQPQSTSTPQQKEIVPPVVIVVPVPVVPIPSETTSPPEVVEPTPNPEPVEPPLISLPTEAQAKPKIVLEGVRDGNVVTFSWDVSGFKEQVQCKLNGEAISQEVRSKVITSAEPYTLTIVCVGIKSASQSEESLTK